MGNLPVIYATLETDLVPSGLSGGLGILATDTFREARHRNFPFYLFAPFYPTRLQQSFDGKNVKSNVVQASPERLTRVDSFTLDTQWYPVNATVYLHPESTETTRAYFVRLSSVDDRNGWLEKIQVYNEMDEGQQIFLRYAFSKAMARFLKRSNVIPRLYHLNESDTAPLVLVAEEEGIALKEDGTRHRFVGHTHTPEKHGHKEYDVNVARSLLGNAVDRLAPYQHAGHINFGRWLAVESDVVCCVSELHGNVTSRNIYPDLNGKITSITNGVGVDWIAPYLQRLFDMRAAGWKEDVGLLHSVHLTEPELLQTYQRNQAYLARRFMGWMKKGEVVATFGEDDMRNGTIVTFAKRLTEYKRPDRLLEVAREFPDSIFIFAGRPVGEWGYAFLNNVIEEAKNSGMRIAYVLNYDRYKAEALVSGSKVWVNIPESAREASGTSWQKVLANGRLLVSTLGGSVPEVLVDSVNGFVVRDDLSNLRGQLNAAIHAEGSRHAELSGAAISSSPHVLIPRMFDEYVDLLYAEAVTIEPQKVAV